MTTTGVTLSMKLVIDKKAQLLLFAEASKDVVDFLFSLLALPVATAVKLLGKESMVGCVGNLYASVDKLNSAYVQGGVVKDALLCPTVFSFGNSLLGLPEKTLHSITLLNTLSVKDVGDLQEKTVQLGYNEGLAILKASLQSKTVLTDVFLADKKAHGGRA
ncbi:unnamed protein product [Urochloa decumbens]|uniref:DUF674 family protein n=1 Tax=Urochloa decumbens TaxID=240449 RepID=A0ABC9AI74_9POAL